MDEKGTKLHLRVTEKRDTLHSGLLQLIWVWLCCFGLSNGVQLSFSGENRGYQLRSPYTKMSIRSSPWHQKHILITKEKHDTIVKVTHGPFSANTSLLDSNPKLFNKTDSLQLTVKVLNDKVMPDAPKVQVLVYSSHLGSVNDNTKWCFHMYVHNKQQNSVIASCVLTNSLHICMLKATLPQAWWTGAKTSRMASLYYSVGQIRERWQCTSARNSIVPGKMQRGSDGVQKVYVSDVALMGIQPSQYRRLKRDHHILLDIPKKKQYTGSAFYVPVNLQAESDLRIFVIKVKARHGLKVLAVKASNPLKWHINVDLNHKQKGATVTAFVKDATLYSKLASIQEIFQWKFGVDSLLPGKESGRLVFNIEYEMNSKQQQKTIKNNNKVVAHIDFTSDAIRLIQPIAKTTEVINTAGLTDRHLTFPIKVYTVSYQGQVHEVTRNAACTSQDSSVLKVSPSCSVAYVDGSETHGSENVTINIKYGKHKARLTFKVWMPELPLEIWLSDSRLSPIKSWRIPRSRQKRSNRKRNRRKGKSYLKAHPRSLLKGGTFIRQNKIYGTYCNPLYQHSMVEVYARFYMHSSVLQKKVYLPSKKAALKVTELVMDKLRIADTSIAELKNNIIRGKSIGRTEIQVVSRQGRVQGAREVRVINERVSIKNLQIKTVSGLGLELKPWPPMPNTYIATVHQSYKLQRQYQAATLDVTIQFTDNTLLPLKYISSDHYTLEVTSLNKNVARVAKPYDASMPKIIALRPTKGELLKVALESYYSCRRKKSRSLAVSYVNIDIDFSKDKNSQDHLQNDDGRFVFPNRASNSGSLPVLVKSDIKVDKSILHVAINGADPATVSNTHKDNKEDVGIPLGIDLADLGKQVKNSVDLRKPIHMIKPTTQKQAHKSNKIVKKSQVTKAHKMTPLEIGMYVLLAVFCVAIVVFLANCIVFVVKYRRKRMPNESMESIAQAQDWVWVGCSTLERNAVKTHPVQTLMSQEAFDGDDGYLTPHGSISSDSPRNSISSKNSRHSTVSTYKGAECSIRITTNPVADEECASSTVSSLQWNAKAMGMSDQELMKYFQQLKESTA